MRYFRRLLGRPLRLAVTFLIVTLATAAMLELTPGDPAFYIAGETATPEQVEAVRQQYNFDDPLLTRYASWLGDMVQGDFGRSHTTRQPIRDIIQQRLPVTLELAVLATLLALGLALPLGVACAQRAGSRFDRAVTAIMLGSLSAPSFVLAISLAYVFAIQFEIFPLLGWIPLTENPYENLKSAALPVVSIAVGQAVVMHRVLRADLVATLQQDYIAVARSKGLSKRRIMWYHAFKPSSFSLLTISAISLATLLGGTVLVESIFSLPGLGLFLLNSIYAKDLAAVQGVVAFIAVAFLLTNFAVDMLYGILDPRTRAE